MNEIGILITRKQSCFAGDLGLLTYLTCADGNAVENPRLGYAEDGQTGEVSNANMRDVKKEAKTKKNCAYKSAKQHAFIKNARKDFLHKLSSALVKFYDHSHF